MHINLRPRPRTFLEYLSQRSYGDLFTLWVLVNAVFALFYFLLASTHPDQAPTGLALQHPLERLFNSFYFSVITGTSTGYGDIVPQGFSKLLAMVQTCTALLVFAIFVTKLVSSRTEATLREVHRMSLDGIFYHIRHVLFIVRKDVDGLLSALAKHKTLGERDWEILQTACLQAESLVEEIPELYGSGSHDLATIDGKRERLLIEALSRTLKRVGRLQEELEEHGVTWDETNADARQSLLGLLRAADSVLKIWADRAREEREALQDLRVLAQTLENELEKRD